MKNSELKELEKYSTKLFEEWIEKYKTDEVPEEQRITDYVAVGNGYSYSGNDEYLEFSVSFRVTKCKEDSDFWREKNTCFIKLKLENGEYVTDYISNIPRNYDKFLEEFEKYEAENNTVEVQEVQVEENLANLENIKIINNSFIITCTICLIIAISYLIIKLKK